MAKTTTTLLEIITSELRGNGFNEFFNNNQLTFFNDKFSYIKKAMNYDNDVAEIVNLKFFLGFKLNDENFDKKFKQMFLNNFLYREIKPQTLEVFASIVCKTFLANELYLNALYENFDKFLTAEKTSVGNSKNNTLHDNRNAFQDLSQDKVNIDLKDDTFEYASNNGISKDKTESINDNETKSNDFNVDNLNKLKDLLNDILKEFDKNCFLQVFS